MPVPEHPMLPYLVDLESCFEPNARRDYDPAELVRYGLGASDYWAELALDWVEQGVPGNGLEDALLALEEQRARPQSLRHQARRIMKSL